MVEAETKPEEKNISPSVMTIIKLFPHESFFTEPPTRPLTLLHEMF